MQNISFRPISESDFALLHRWLNEEEVLAWYSKRPSSIADVEAKYRPRLVADSPVQVYLLSLDGEDMGLFQAYVLRHFPEYVEPTGADPLWVGIDFFLGEPRFRGIGFGARAIERFAAEFVFGAGHSHCCCSPNAINQRSIRALFRAGFSHVRAAVLPSGDVEHLMVRHA